MHNILWGLLTHREVKIHNFKYMWVWWCLNYYPDSLGPSSRDVCLTFPTTCTPLPCGMYLGIVPDISMANLQFYLLGGSTR